MKVLLFGATGMVGQGVLRECLLAPDVSQVATVGRRAGEGQGSVPKLRELVPADLFDLEPLARELSGFDACFFCLGVSSAGMKEEAYQRVTFDLTLSIARTLLAAGRNPNLTFVYVSGAGTDGTEKGSAMWARVKGKTENALLALPFKAAFMMRPGFIQPLHGIRSRTAWYRALYAALTPVVPLVRALSPRSITSTESVGRAMLTLARKGAPNRIVEMPDIQRLAAAT